MQQSSFTQQILAKWTLGNIGETAFECRFKDYKVEGDDWNIRCPKGSQIKSLEKFGL